MLESVAAAIATIGQAAKEDGVTAWFLAVRDPDSNDRHARIHGDMEEGFALAHLALAGQAGGPINPGEMPRLFQALRETRGWDSVQTWLFACRVPGNHGGLRMSFLSAGMPEAAIGLGVTCLTMMVAGHLNGDIRFAQYQDPPLGSGPGILNPPPENP